MQHTFQGTLVWDWEFLPPQQLPLSTATSESQFPLKLASPEQPAASLQPATTPNGVPPHGGFSPLTTLPVWLFSLTVSVFPWLSEFHAVWFFWHFWLFIDFRLVVIQSNNQFLFGCVMKRRVSTYTSTWPELSHDVSESVAQRTRI